MIYISQNSNTVKISPCIAPRYNAKTLAIF